MSNAYQNARNSARVKATKSVSARNVSAPFSASELKGAKINRGFRALSVRVFAKWFSKMVTNASASPLFEKSEPTIEALNALDKTYQEAVLDAENRTGPNAVPAEWNQMILAKAATDTLADWIETQTTDQAQMVEIAGMHYKMPKSRLVPRPDQLTNVKLELSGVRTSLLFSCDPQSHLSGIRYFVEASLDKGKTWQLSAVASNSRRIVVSNLVKGQDYWFRMYAETSGGKSEPNDPPMDWTGQ